MMWRRSETLHLLAQETRSMEEVHKAMVEKVEVGWETEHQVRYRLHWLEACGAIAKGPEGWRVASQ